MSMGVEDFVAEARALEVGDVCPKRVYGYSGLILDVRESDELSRDGRIEDAFHVPRGMLEVRADPETGAGESWLLDALATERCVNVLCASGTRATLAAGTLARMGYRTRVIEGGLKGWKRAGLPLAQ